MKRLTVIIFLLCFFTSNVLGQLNYGQKRIIFGKESYVQLNLTEDTSYQRFTPYFTDIDSMDVFISKDFHPDNNFTNKNLVFEDYYRQYFGIWLNGKKCLFIKGFCYEVECLQLSNCGFMGGGACFFKILVDIDNKKILISRFNAPK